jgi:hypothetical protein
MLVILLWHCFAVCLKKVIKALLNEEELKRRIPTGFFPSLIPTRRWVLGLVFLGFFELSASPFVVWM